MDKITHQVRCKQWSRIIKECYVSGMSKAAWCREHGISDKSFLSSTKKSKLILRKEAIIALKLFVKKLAWK